jgi:histidine triad (HIT) family protein
MADSIFTKIIKGELPSHKVYEDDKTFAFMDIHPIQTGHVLLVSKNPAVTVWDLSDEDYKAMMQTAHKIADKLKEVFPDKKRIGVMIEGLEVDHAHIKIFPINTGDEFRQEPNMDIEPDHAALAALAEKLAIKDN